VTLCHTDPQNGPPTTSQAAGHTRRCESESGSPRALGQWGWQVESSSHTSDLELLEQAELAARERRLAASAEADRIVAAGRERAAEIIAGADDRVATALEQLRERTTAEADRAVAELEQEADARARSRTEPSERDAAVGDAVEQVVAAVLGESMSGGD